MKSSNYRWICITAVTAGMLVAGRHCAASDQLGLTGEFSLPDRLRNLVDTQDEYYDAVQRLQDADAAVMRARESAMKDAQSTPEYAAAVKAVDQTYQAYIDKKNAVAAEKEKSDPVYNKMKSQAAQIDSQIEAAEENPATTPEQLEELYKNRETFQNQWHQLETDALERAGIAPLRQAWMDACKHLSDLQEKQRVEVENSERLKAALTEAAAAKSAVDEVRAAISGSADPAQLEQSSATDLLCKSTRTAFTGNDAWWTYGWTGVPEGKAVNTSAPTGK